MQKDELYVCLNCEKKWEITELNDIQDVFQRIDVGEPMAAGECPECGALCQPVEAPKPPDWTLLFLRDIREWLVQDGLLDGRTVTKEEVIEHISVALDLLSDDSDPFQGLLLVGSWQQKSLQKTPNHG